MIIKCKIPKIEWLSNVRGGKIIFCGFLPMPGHFQGGPKIYHDRSMETIFSE